MKVESPWNMHLVAGTRCRQSPLRGLAGGLIVCAILIGSVFVLRHFGVPTFVWVGGAVLAALFVPLAIADVVARFRATNWLLLLGGDGLWINFRNYQNRLLPDAATVLRLPCKEIATARRHIDTWTTPAELSALTGTHWKLESLELSLASRDTRELAKALADERARRAAIKGMHQAVTIPAEGVIRIAWRGHGNDVAPGLTRVLDELRPRVKVLDPTRTDRAPWHELDGTELDDLVAQLARSGDNLIAAQLLVRRRGISHAAAHQFVEEQATRI